MKCCVAPTVTSLSTAQTLIKLPKLFSIRTWQTRKEAVHDCQNSHRSKRRPSKSHSYGDTSGCQTIALLRNGSLCWPKGNRHTHTHSPSLSQYLLHTLTLLQHKHLWAHLLSLSHTCTLKKIVCTHVHPLQLSHSHQFMHASAQMYLIKSSVVAKGRCLISESSEY